MQVAAGSVATDDFDYYWQVIIAVCWGCRWYLLKGVFVYTSYVLNFTNLRSVL